MMFVLLHNHVQKQQLTKQKQYVLQMENVYAQLLSWQKTNVVVLAVDLMPSWPGIVEVLVNI